MTNTLPTMPTYAISHGGGPWPWTKGYTSADWSNLEHALAGIPDELGITPRAVLMITAHWEAPAFTVGTNPAPGMIYDYGGFPAHTYEVVYPAPGQPEVAQRAHDLLAAAGLPAATDPDRGFDHGTFVPMYAIYPEANVPVVQMSVHQSFDPALHLEAGRALAPLRDEGVLIIGSGLPSYHDLSNLGPNSTEPSREFDAWLTETLVDTGGSERSGRLAHWAMAPSARRAHPREEHFVPLLVAVGAAEHDAGFRNYHETTMLGYTASSGYRLGELAA